MFPFSKKQELKDFYSAITLKKEIFYEIRKNIPQTQYVFFISDEELFYDEKKDTFVSAPIEFQGYWIQEYPDDNTMISLEDRLGIHNNLYTSNFVKAKMVEVTIQTFEKL